MAFSTIGFLSVKAVWEYFNCKEPEWSIYTYLGWKPVHSCPIFTDVLKVLSGYAILLSLILFVFIHILKKTSKHSQNNGSLFRGGIFMKSSMKSNGAKQKKKSKELLKMKIPSGCSGRDVHERVKENCQQLLKKSFCLPD